MTFLRHSFLHLTVFRSLIFFNCRALNVEIGVNPNDQHCHVNYVNLASGKHYCISLTKALLNMEIGVTVKLNFV